MLICFSTQQRIGYKAVLSIRFTTKRSPEHVARCIPLNIILYSEIPLIFLNRMLLYLVKRFRLRILVLSLAHVKTMVEQNRNLNTCVQRDMIFGFTRTARFMVYRLFIEKKRTASQTPTSQV